VIPHPSTSGEYPQDPQTAVHALLAWLADWWPAAAPALIAGAVLLLLARRQLRRRRLRRLNTGARCVTVLTPPAVDPAGADALWSNLVGLLRPAWRRTLAGQPHLAFEYAFAQDGVRIQLWVPGPVPPGMAERAIEAAWPGAHTRTRPARPPIPTAAPAGRRLLAAGGELRLARGETLPLRTDFDADPLRALLGAPAGLGRHEHAAVQVLARPVAGRRVARARRASAGAAPHPFGRILDLLTPGARTTTGRTVRAVAPDRQTALDHSQQDRAAVAKQRGALYETRIRYAVAVAADDELGAGGLGRIRDHLAGRAHALASAFAGYGGHNHYRRARLRRPLPALADRRLAGGDLLSVPELAVLAHLPLDEAVPGVQRAGARAVPPPPGVPGGGERVKPIGTTDAGQARPVGLHAADARHHVHILGATGSGKSELIARMILADADAGRGLVAVDPKGDLVADVLARIPADRAGRVVLFDADDRTRPPCLNPLDQPDRTRAVDNLVSIFSRVYARAWGPRTDDILRAGLLTLAAQPGTPTLADLPRLLAVPAYRARALDAVHDEVLAGFWDWYDALSEPARAHATAPLMNKLRGFLLRPFVRAAIAAGPSTVDLDAVLDGGGVCLARLAQDALGAETAALTGSILVAATWQAATRRARTPQSRRRDAALYIDECHNFLNLPYPLEDLLAAARAYRLSVVLAHQNLAQLPKDLEEGVAANARTKLYFTVSPDDARRLARHTAPRLSENDLCRLDAFHLAARLVVAGAEAPAFTAVTEKLPPPVPGRGKQVRAAARAHTTASSPPTAPTAAGQPRRGPGTGAAPRPLPAAAPSRTPRRAANPTATTTHGRRTRR
jgi:hypothetical protein